MQFSGWAVERINITQNILVDWMKIKCFIIFLFIITGKSLVPKQTDKMEKTEYATSENPTRKSQVSHLANHSVKVVY